MNKRGFLLGEETLKIIIALICIVFLIYFLVSLYYSKVNEQKLKEAEALLKDSPESIEAKIDNLENVNPAERQLVNPKGWYLFSFTQEQKPNSCVGKNCLCICPKLWSLNFWGEQAEKCDEDGVCLIVEDLRGFNMIKIDHQFIIIRKQAGTIQIEEK
jgi:hypothetical protein